MHPIRIGRALTILLIIPLLPGCGKSSYELTLEPMGDSLSRTLVYSDGNAQPATEEGNAPPPPTPSAEAERLATVYKIEVPQAVDGAYRFKGTFTGSTPNDVGGAGRYTQKETSLGSLSVYVERFRGSYELAGTVEQRFEKVEMLTSLLAHWVRTTGKESPLRDRLEQVVNEELQRDLKNVVVLAIAVDANIWEPKGEQFWLQLAQYFSERGYLDLNLVLSGYAGGDSQENALHLLRRSLMLKLQLEDEAVLQQTWPALATPETFTASLNEVIEDTDAYRQEAPKWTEELEQKELPEGSEFLGGLLMEVLGLEIAPGDSLTVYLECPLEPIATNGVWMSQDTRVRWEKHLSHRNAALADTPPELCYAIWSEPDREFQQQHFGGVLLEGERLATYCGWRGSLKEDEGAEWDRLIEGLAGGENLEAAVSKFKFSGTEETQSPAAREVENIKELLHKDKDD